MKRSSFIVGLLLLLSAALPMSAKAEHTAHKVTVIPLDPVDTRTLQNLYKQLDSINKQIITAEATIAFKYLATQGTIDNFGGTTNIKINKWVNGFEYGGYQFDKDFKYILPADSSDFITTSDGSKWGTPSVTDMSSWAPTAVGGANPKGK